MPACVAPLPASGSTKRRNDNDVGTEEAMRKDEVVRSQQRLRQSAYDTLPDTMTIAN